MTSFKGQKLLLRPFVESMRLLRKYDGPVLPVPSATRSYGGECPMAPTAYEHIRAPCGSRTLPGRPPASGLNGMVPAAEVFIPVGCSAMERYTLAWRPRMPRPL